MVVCVVRIIIKNPWWPRRGAPGHTSTIIYFIHVRAFIASALNTRSLPDLEPLVLTALEKFSGELLEREVQRISTGLDFGG